MEFSENAVISEGGNQISSNYLVYNITEQRIKAQSAGEGDPRVKITYTPRQDDAPAEPPDTELPAAGEEDASETDDETAGDGPGVNRR